MIYWPHNDDLTKPPELTDLKYRKPEPPYWFSNAASKEVAISTFWIRWHRETGLIYPRDRPIAPCRMDKGPINRVQGARRIDRRTITNE